MNLHKNMEYITWKDYKIIERENISLWPTICNTNDRSVLVVWYEYNSKTEVKPSDIFFTTLKDGKIGLIKKLSSYTGYDNGPNIIQDKYGSTWFSWHSWRDPGKGPFIPDSTENIWMKCKYKSDTWSDEFLPFPNMKSTNYPSLIQINDGRYVMVFSIESRNEIYISVSTNGFLWDEPRKIEIPGLVRADIIEDNCGQYLITCERKESNSSDIIVIKSNDLNDWGNVTKLPGSDNGYRPKISQNKHGDYLITWHSNHWGSNEYIFYSEVLNEYLNITFESDNSGGNACWALNYIEITNKENNFCKIFNFGVNGINESNKYIKITDKNCLFGKNNYGFTDYVYSMVRNLGDDLTTDFVYCNKKNTFKIHVPNGQYRIKCILSSWIASTKKITITINGCIVYKPDNCDHDKSFYSISHDGKSWNMPNIIKSNNYDINRPSKIIEYNNQYIVALTVFNQHGVFIELMYGKHDT